MSDIDLYTDNLGIETIYYLLRKKSEKNKNQILIEHSLLNNSDFGFSKEYIKNAIKYIPFNEKSNWNYSTFSTSLNKYNIQFPEILSNSWTATSIDIDDGIDITNKIFECEDNIDYRIVNNLIKANIILEGDGMFWVFLHVNNQFDENTVVILFSKKEYTQRVTMSLGAFINLEYFKSPDEKGNNFYIFQKQQLIKTYKKKKNENDKYEKKDGCLIKITIIDEGYENIKIIAKLNDGEVDNELIGRIYNPVANIDNYDQNSTNNNNDQKIYKVMIAGNGTSCKVNNFHCETKLKNIFENNRIQMVEGCQCCHIF